MTPKIKRQRVNKRLQDLPDTSKCPVIKLDQVCLAAGFPFDQQEQQQQQQEDDSAITLQNILAPLDTDVFLDKCFRQCAVYAPPALAENDRFQHLREHLFDLDPAMLLRETSSDNIFVWLCQQPSGLIHSVEIADPESALALWKSGHSTYCRAPPHVEQHLVSSLLTQTGLGCGQYDATGQSTTCLGRGEVEVFISAPGHRTNWHYDFQENFTLQLSGVKQWSLQRGIVKHPLRGCTPHYASPESVEAQLKSAHLSNPNFAFGHPQDGGVTATGPVDQVTLRPGSVLYFPAGMWHKIDVLEPGVSINISLMASNYADVTCQALKHLLLKEDDWREAVVNNSATSVADHLKVLLDKLPGIIDNLQATGGAETIIPPILLTGSVVGIEVEDEDEKDNELADEDSVDDENEGLDYDVVQPTAEFVERHCVSESELCSMESKSSLIINPLASLLREDEVRAFYSQEGVEGDNANTTTVRNLTFIININYAGNEPHESVVRKRISSNNTRVLQVLCDMSKQKRTGNGDCILPAVLDLMNDEVERAILGFLVHCGYLAWIPKQV